MLRRVKLTVKVNEGRLAPYRGAWNRAALRALHVILICAVVASAVASPGCYWLRYEEIAATHVDLMERLAIDQRDLMAEAGEPADASDLKRLRYPLARALRFLDIVGGRRPDSVVLARLETVTEAYERFVEHLEAMGTREPGPEDIARVNELVEAVSVAAQQARDAIDSGQG